MRRALAGLLPMALVLAAVPDLAELNRMIARFAPATVTADTSKLSPGDKQALARLIEAAKVINTIFREQLWSGNVALGEKLAQDSSPLGKARFHYYVLNNGPWSDLDNDVAFIHA